MSPEMRLVQEIEKFECLYNTFLPEYNRKDLVEEAWAEVSCTTELPVAECKEKWRNIRSSLLRNLKPSDKARKPYYLMPFLHFVMPFLKPINHLEVKDDTHILRSVTKEPDIFLCSVKSEDECRLMCDTQSFINTEGGSDDVISDPLLSQSASLPQKRKISDDSIYIVANKRPFEYGITNETTNPMTRIDLPRTSNDSISYFLFSLIPELETMSEDQVRQFQIRTMMAIDDIKCEGDKGTSNKKLNMDRIQKRLINLLLKNLSPKK